MTLDSLALVLVFTDFFKKVNTLILNWWKLFTNNNKAIPAFAIGRYGPTIPSIHSFPTSFLHLLPADQKLYTLMLRQKVLDLGCFIS